MRASAAAALRLAAASIAMEQARAFLSKLIANQMQFQLLVLQLLPLLQLLAIATTRSLCNTRKEQ